MPIENFISNSDGDPINSNADAQNIGIVGVITPLILPNNLIDKLNVLNPAVANQLKIALDKKTLVLDIDKCAFGDEIIKVDKVDICNFPQPKTPTLKEIYKKAGVNPETLIQPDPEESCTIDYINKLLGEIDVINNDYKELNNLVSNSSSELMNYHRLLLLFIIQSYSLINLSVINEKTNLLKSIIDNLNDAKKTITNLSITYPIPTAERDFLLGIIDKLLVYSKSNIKSNIIDPITTSVRKSLNTINEITGFIIENTVILEQNPFFGVNPLDNPTSGAVIAYINTFGRSPSVDEASNVDAFIKSLDTTRLSFLGTTLTAAYNIYINVILDNVDIFTYSYQQASSGDLSLEGNIYTAINKTYLDDTSLLVSAASNFLVNSERIYHLQDKDIIKNRLASIKRCGHPSDFDTPAKEYNINMGTQDTQYGEDSDHTKIAYWRKYASEITKINALPLYWKIGLLVPNPSGITKIPLPIIWTAVVSFFAPVVNIQTVVFLTINGVFIAPVVYQIKYRPTADAESVFISVIRGVNKSIKIKTGNKVAGLPVVNLPIINIPKNSTAISKNLNISIPFTQEPPFIAGVNVDPTLGQTLPFSQEDLPIVEHLQAFTNLPYTNYLKDFLQTATQTMGFP